MMDDAQHAVMTWDESDATPLAPWWHTAAIVGVLVLWAVLGRHRLSATSAQRDHVSMYLSMMMMSWLMLGSAIAGIYDRGRFFYDAFRRNALRWSTEIARGITIYFAVIFAAMIVMVIAHVLPHAPQLADTSQGAVKSLAPQRAREALLWLGVSMTAGVCEELVFRGYLLRQCIAWMRRVGMKPTLAQSSWRMRRRTSSPD